MGFKFNLVLADSLYGESANFISVLDELNLNYIVAIRSNHSVELLPRQRIQYLKWHRFKEYFPISLEYRFIREIILASVEKKVLADYYRYCCIT